MIPTESHSHAGFSCACRLVTNLSVRHRPARCPLVQINYFPSHRALADPYWFRKSTGSHLAIYPTARYAESPLYVFAAQQFLCLGFSYGSRPFLLSPGPPFQVRDLRPDRFLLPRSGICASCCHRWKSVRSAALLPKPPHRPGDTGHDARRGGRPVHRPSTCSGSACSLRGPGKQRPGASSEMECRQLSCGCHLGACFVVGTMFIQAQQPKDLRSRFRCYGTRPCSGSRLQVRASSPPPRGKHLAHGRRAVRRAGACPP